MQNQKDKQKTPKQIFEDNLENIIRDLENRVTKKEVAKNYKMSAQTLRTHLKNNNIVIVKTEKPKSKNKKKKDIFGENIDEIIEDLDNMEQEDVAIKWGMGITSLKKCMKDFNIKGPGKGHSNAKPKIEELENEPLIEIEELEDEPLIEIEELEDEPLIEIGESEEEPLIEIEELEDNDEFYIEIKYNDKEDEDEFHIEIADYEDNDEFYIEIKDDKVEEPEEEPEPEPEIIDGKIKYSKKDLEKIKNMNNTPIVIIDKIECYENYYIADHESTTETLPDHEFIQIYVPTRNMPKIY